MTLRWICLLTIISMTAACGPGGEAGPSDAGRVAFRECATCHASAPPDTPAGAVRLVGPSLFGVYNAHAGHMDGYAYSDAMRRSAVIWDEATLDAYIEKPQAVVRGTRMSFPGEPDAQKRKAIIDYLKSLK